ncbi:hypothetical protein RhiirA1_444681 [Rhizophagus irregularis]|uniref:Uncharacterized protein n=1 Tax=Rhizophagus irregularis TaxID=588596 RepID=A0A2N0RCA7_9GLOM|nr:hypothetical protein RhiirA1_444681 [Rhizophagus irregularis]
MEEIYKLNLIYQTKSDDLVQLKENDSLYMNSSENYTSSSKLFTSKIHQFENLPEPRNATEAFHSNKSYDFHIPNNIDDIGNLGSQNNNSSKINYQEIMQQMKRDHINIDDEEEIYNNPNFHSEEQDEFELPENMDEIN